MTESTAQTAEDLGRSSMLLELSAVMAGNIDRSMVENGVVEGQPSTAEAVRDALAQALEANVEIVRAFAQRARAIGDTQWADVLDAMAADLDQKRLALVETIPEGEEAEDVLLGRIAACISGAIEGLDQNAHRIAGNATSYTIMGWAGDALDAVQIAIAIKEGNAVDFLKTVTAMATTAFVTAIAGSALALVVTGLPFVFLVGLTGALVGLGTEELAGTFFDDVLTAVGLHQDSPDDIRRAIEAMVAATGSVMLPNAGWNIMVGTTGDDTLTNNQPDQQVVISAGNGNDLVFGGGLADRIAGGSGNDILRGGVGNDTLLGGAGDDTLESGLGSDVLEGGDGNDVYQFSSDDLMGGSLDVIRDSDGQGTITFNGVPILGSSFGSAYRTENSWHSSDDTFLFLLSGSGTSQTLTIVHRETNTRIRVENWQNGQFGITLDMTPPAGFVYADAELGFGGHNVIFVMEGQGPVRGTESNDIIGVSQGAVEFAGAPEGWLQDAMDAWGAALFDHGDGWYVRTADGQPYDPNEHGHTQQVVIHFWTAEALPENYINRNVISHDFRIFAGGGDDAVRTGTGADTVDGESGDDAIWGGGGDDLLDGGDDRDVLTGEDGNDTLVGGYDNDQLYGEQGADVLNGGQGDDTLVAGDDDDELSGGDDNDILLGNDGNDTLHGDSGDDHLQGDGGADRIYGGEGDDMLQGVLGTDHLEGGLGNDTLFGGDGTDTMLGGDGMDVLVGGSGDDEMSGEEGGDELHGDGSDVHGSQHGSDTLLGGGGDDTIFGQGGDDLISGGDGNDQLVGDATSTELAYHGNDMLSGGLGDDQLFGAGGNDTLHGDDGNDTLAGDETSDVDGDDVLSGGRGNDLLLGRAGNDEMYGGDGNDNVDGGLGDDDMYGDAGSDQMYGDAGNDTLHGGAGTDTINGGAGNDSIEGGSEYDYLVGSEGNDAIDGGDGGDALLGGVGDDTLLGGAGNDTLQGDEGDDVLDGGAGSDTMSGGGGVNTYHWDFNQGYDRISAAQAGAASGSTVVFAAGIDPSDLELSVFGDNLVIRPTVETGASGQLEIFSFGAVNGTSPVTRFEFADGTVWLLADVLAQLATGSWRDDYLVGFSLDETLHGGLGNDTIYGAGGQDLIFGDEGADRLYGEDGEDTLVGGAGNDSLYGGAGADTFDFSLGDGNDTIFNTDSTDVLRLGAGISPLDVVMARSGDDLLIQIVGSENTIHVSGHFRSGNYGLERIEFHGGLEWDAAYIAGLVGPATSVDTLQGTAADDDHYVDNPGDVVLEAANGGNDTVYASTSYVLQNNIENLVLTGWFGWTGTGNSLNNVMHGNAGNNTFYAGNGTDTVHGGEGDDTYYDTESVIEHEGEGFDTVYRTTTGATLQANVERLIVDSTSGYAYGNTYTGNDLDNVIDVVRTIVQTTIDGGGGADQMIYRGNQAITFVVDDAGDTFTVLNNMALVTIRSSMAGAYVLSERVDNFVSTSALDVNVVGNDRDNLIDVADAGEGTVVSGGGGDDTYVIASGMVVNEAEGGGIDTIEFDTSNSSYTLGDNIENLRLTGSAYTSPATGNALDNRIYGNEYNNVLNGLDGNDTLVGDDGHDTLHGGAGDDVMNGGAGSDTYYVDSLGDVVNDSDLGRVYSSVDFTLTGGLTTLNLLGNAVVGHGNSGYNYLTGNDVGNVMSGFDGHDSIIGGLGDDMLDGGDGHDTLDGGDGNDTLEGGVAVDILYGGSDRIDGGAGADVIFGRNGVDSLNGGDGDDTIEGGSENDRIWGDSGNDDLSGDEGADTLDGGAGNDLLHGGSGDDQVLGGAGDDTLRGGEGSDTLIGGSGLDTYVYEMGDGPMTLQEYGSDDGDVLLLGAGFTTENVVLATDPVSGMLSLDLGGESIVLGYPGSTVEFIEFADGTRWDLGEITNRPPDIYEDPIELVSGGQFEYSLLDHVGDEDAQMVSIEIISGLPSWLSFDPVTMVLSGEAPMSGISASSLEIRVTDRYGASVVGTIPLVPVNGVQGTAGADSLSGTALRDVIIGYEGNDTLSGLGGEDYLVGGDGDDYIDGGSGGDEMAGGLGDDTYVVDNTFDDDDDSDSDGIDEGEDEGTDTVLAWVDGYSLDDSVENLTLMGSAAISGSGNEYDNVLTGNSAANVLFGDEGDDLLNGMAGDDTLEGGEGDDIYIVEQSGDLVIEDGQDDGEDTVRAYRTYTLGENVEVLELMGTAGYTGNGNSLDNTIIGNGASNRLNGYGGEDMLIGGGGNDTLNGGNNDDVLDGGAGNDSLTGGSGYDIYQLGRGYGTDTVIENSSSASNRGDVETLEGISFDQLWFRRPSGSNNLEISIIGTSDKLVIRNWFSGSQYQVQEIWTHDGMMLTASGVAAVMSVMATMTMPTAGQTDLSAAQQAELAEVFADHWQDMAGDGGGMQSLAEDPEALLLGDAAVPVDPGHLDTTRRNQLAPANRPAEPVSGWADGRMHGPNDHRLDLLLQAMARFDQAEPQIWGHDDKAKAPSIQPITLPPGGF